MNASRRLVAGMAGAIPLGLEYSEVSAYAEAHGYQDVQRTEFETLMQQMDGVYLAHMAEKSKPKGVR